MALRVLIVDDMVSYRKILSDVMAEIPEVEVGATAASGGIALKKLAAGSFDLVLLDVHMPEMDGVETLRRIRKEFPDVAVVMVSGETTRSADSTIAALELGAVDFIRKPDGPDAAANRARLCSDIQSVARLVSLRLLAAGGARKFAAVAPEPAAISAKPAAVRPPAVAPVTFGVCVIGVSTGGPEALSRVVPAFQGRSSCRFYAFSICRRCSPGRSQKSGQKITDTGCGGAGRRACAGRNHVYRAGRTPHGRASGKCGMRIGLNDEPPETAAALRWTYCSGRWRPHMVIGAFLPPCLPEWEATAAMACARSSAADVSALRSQNRPACLWDAAGS